MNNLSPFLTVASLFLLTCCEDREVFLNEKNSAPVLLLHSGKSDSGQSGSTQSVTDSAKYSIKIKQKSLSLPISFTDENNNLKEVVINKVSGKSADAETAFISTETNTKNVTFNIKGLGITVFEIIARDYLGGEGKKTYTVNVFENLAPVANLSITVYEKDKFYVTLDASASKDRDAKFGGAIKEYQYTIDGVSLNTTSTYQDHSFGAIGNHTITLVVIDNDGAASPAVSKRLTIN